MNRHWIIIGCILLVVITCKQEDEVKQELKPGKLFEALSPSASGVRFKNNVEDLRDFNYLLFQYMYNGGGVAAGDINNDGLPDLYFSSNQTSNKLYLNQGNFQFKDITESAGVSDVAGWSTGVAFNDFNNDGWLDIYVCKSASLEDDQIRKNKLFINEGNETFREVASEWGLDDAGYSVQSYFLDFDKDGDLDMYLVNHRTDFSDNMKTDSFIESNYSPLTSDQLYRNEGDHFTNVTEEAGVMNHAWGLSASIGDFNQDGWEDIYVCNDFVQGDYLYINNQDGSFSNEVNSIMDHISFYSMGSDYDDLNNDLLPDLVVLDMVSENHERNIRNMAAMDVEKFRDVYEIGYHRQYMFNMFQLNNGNGTYSEIAQAAGLAKSDWSWAPLIADLNNDGYKDIYVTNGIKRDVTDIDYKDYVMNRGLQGRPLGFTEVFDQWPATKLRNYVFKNEGALAFKNAASEWGIDHAVNSNGCAYADLDNDGDLELITNNIDDIATIYKNNASNNYLVVKLNGPENNPLGIGAKVIIEYGGMNQSRNHYLTRGYISSVEPGCYFGLGESQKADRVKVLWPDGRANLLFDVGANQEIEVNYSDAKSNEFVPNNKEELFDKSDLKIDFTHVPNEFDDFEKEVLLPHKQSTFGGRMAKGDVNGDGLEDIFFGNDKGSAPSLFVQSSDGSFQKQQQTFWNAQSEYEDMEAEFFDSDSDGDLDLFVVSGGNEVSIVSEELRDRLYLNDGSGRFTLSKDILPDYLISGCSISISDIDKDGDMDVFVGGKIVPGKYPVPASGILLENNNGKFADVTLEKAPDLKQMGMTTDSKFADYDSDGDQDLILVGEWMPVTILENDNGSFVEKIELKGSRGWWYAIDVGDFDNDGDLDLVAGNLGKNNKFKATKGRPFHVYANDFDGNGTLDIVLTKEQNGTLLPVRGRECSSEQMPFIKQKFPTFTQFGKATLAEIYGQDKLDQALHYTTETFASSYFEQVNGSFKRQDLDIRAQFSPTFSFLVDDFNHDGNLDILGVGNLYEAEAETVRYDAGRGYLLIGDGRGVFDYQPNSGLNISADARNVLMIRNTQKDKFIVSGINMEPIIFQKLN